MDNINYLVPIRAYLQARLPSLVSKVVYKLQRIPASGAHGGDYDLRTLWNEFSWEIQNGDGDTLVDLIEDIIQSIVEGLVETLPHEEAVLISCAVSDQVDFIPIRDNDAIVTVILDELSSRASERNLERFDPNYNWYENI